MSRRLIVSGGGPAREFVLVGTMIVGRDPACDISDAADPLLSRRHAEFASATEATVRDLSSRNGILVNGVKVPRAVLRGGDVVQVGTLQVKFVDELGPFLDVPGAKPAVAHTMPKPDSDPDQTVVLQDPDRTVIPDAPATVATPNPSPNAATVLVDLPTMAPEDAVTRKLPS